MENSQVAHLWANKSRSGANGSHFFFDGDCIYSYGHHFLIARHYKGVVLMTTRSYSTTTARHISETRGACSHLARFNVPTPDKDPCKEHVDAYATTIRNLIAKAARARNLDSHLSGIQSQIAEANQFCETFGFKTRFEVPANWDDQSPAVACLRPLGESDAVRSEQAGSVVRPCHQTRHNLSRHRQRDGKAMGGAMMEPGTIQDMRNWIADCVWSDLPADEVADLTETEVVRGVAAHYDGGIEQFLKDSVPYETEKTH